MSVITICAGGAKLDKVFKDFYLFLLAMQEHFFSNIRIPLLIFSITIKVIIIQAFSHQDGVGSGAKLHERFAKFYYLQST